MTSKVPPERACITCNMFSLLTIKNDFGFVTIFRRATAEIFTFLKWLGLNQSQVAIFKLRLNLLFQPSTLVNKWLMAFLIISIEFVRINVLYLVLCLKSKPSLCRVHAGGVLLLGLDFREYFHSTQILFLWNQLALRIDFLFANWLEIKSHTHFRLVWGSFTVRISSNPHMCRRDKHEFIGEGVNRIESTQREDGRVRSSHS